MKKKFKNLIKLLEDDDVEISTKAMAEVLDNEELAFNVLRRLQESSKSQLRKASHQMQVALKLRERKKKVSKKISSKNADFLNMLIDIHLLWFDQDSEECVQKQWNDFKNLSKNWDMSDLRNISEFMIRLSFECAEFEDCQCSDYCIGEIILMGSGADFMLCAIGKLLARDEGAEFSIIATDAGFCLYDEKNKIGLFPAKNWALADCGIKTNVKRWSDEMIAELAASCIFFCSTTQNDFRYSYIFGDLLAGTLDSEFEEIMPYPLGKNL